MPDFPNVSPLDGLLSDFWRDVIAIAGLCLAVLQVIMALSGVRGAPRHRRATLPLVGLLALIVVGPAAIIAALSWFLAESRVVFAIQVLIAALHTTLLLAALFILLLDESSEEFVGTLDRIGLPSLSSAVGLIGLAVGWLLIRGQALFPFVTVQRIFYAYGTSAMILGFVLLLQSVIYTAWLLWNHRYGNRPPDQKPPVT